MHRLSKSRRVYSETTVDSQSYEYLVSELEQIRMSQTRQQTPQTLKHELLKIHHRRSTKSKPRRRQKRLSRLIRVANDINENDTDFLRDASYSKNYAKLAKDFVVSSRYCANSLGRRRDPTCVSCLTNRSENVIFPCEHLCLCDACLDRAEAPKQCPICKCSVHVVLKYTGNVVIDEYIQWVDEVKSPLTKTFMQNFRLNSTGTINAAMVNQQRMQTEYVEHHEESSWMKLLLCRRTSNSSRNVSRNSSSL